MDTEIRGFEEGCYSMSGRRIGRVGRSRGKVGAV
jgi:hypothetical protein